MFVSEICAGYRAGTEEPARADVEPEVEGLGWLARQLAWESALTRLRRAAGLLPAEDASEDRAA